MNDQDSLKVCLFCGSSNLYRDNETDNMVCSDCHTQSQALSQRETTEDDAEMVGTKFAIHKSKETRKRILRQLPELEHFIEAYFTLVEKATERSLELLPDINILGNNPDYKKNVIDDAKEMFILYLERWNDAANYFMLRNPGLRISMRDRLIPHVLPRKILAQLVYNSEKGENLPDTNIFHAQKVERSKGALDNLIPKRKPRTPRRVKFSNDLTESELTAEAQSKEDLQMKIKSKSGTKRKRNQNKSFEPKCWRSKILGIDLNPQLVTAIVYLAHLGSRTGLTTNLLLAWAKDHEYNFILDAFSSLEKSQRNLLNGSECSFKVNDLPDPREIDILASTLLSCFDVKNRKPGDYLRVLYKRNKFMNATVVERKRLMDINDIKPPNGSQRTFFNVGMTALQFCIFLGLEQTVLDCTFALMGLAVHSTKEEKRNLPPSLKLAHPAMITSPIQILAIIAVACKFCPGWEKWKVLELVGFYSQSLKVNQSYDPLPEQSDGESDGDNDSGDEESSVSSDDSYCVRTRKVKSRLRIPVSKHFNDTISSMNSMKPTDLTQSQISPHTRENHLRIVAGETLNSCKTTNLRTRDGSLCFLACKIDFPVPWNQMQIHPSYRLLLEYISFRLLVNVQKLFQHASLLDMELETRSATEPA